MQNELPTSDKELIALLERSFASHADERGRITAEELQLLLGLRSLYLAKRVLAAFDQNASGSVDAHEFVHGVRQLVSGTPREKLTFAFKLHDDDGDGFIDPTEMRRMISLALAESEIIERPTQPAEYLTQILFKAADTNRDGRISLDEFISAVEARPHLLRQMTRAEAIWVAPNEALLSRLDAGESGSLRGIGASARTSWASIVCLGVWILINAALGVLGWLQGVRVQNQDPVMQLGHALGLCIDFNGALILVPMLRRLLTRVRPTWLGRLLPIDDAILSHRVIGHTLFGLALAHATCFAAAYVNGHPSDGLAQLFFGTLTGASGAVLVVVFAVIWTFSLAIIRRTHRFELFYFTHWLYVVWLVVTIIHAPTFLLWAGVPLLAFVVEQILRFSRRAAASRVVRATALRSGVTRLELARPHGFDFDPADYVFLRIPEVAKHEWHPFTLSSAPERDSLTVHVRALGNWSRALRDRVTTTPDVPLTAYIDGPYGSPSAPIFKSRIAVLIGAGIGVTPFASVLESLVLRANGASDRPSRLEKAYFFWLNRDQYSFEWFAALLAELEKLDQRGLLEMHLCMTGARSGGTALGLELAREIMHASGRSDLITGLRIHTHAGPPDWNELLNPILERHGPGAIDAYFCGPPGLGAKLAKQCRGLGMTFREEKF